jgi:cephalosporin-C deacetylase-like acetyl esterase
VRFYFIFSLLIFVKTYAQKTEKIIFQSANQFAFSDIINNLENQTEQEVFGKLTFPKDSINLNKKIPLVIGVAGSLGWREHHYEYMKMFRQSGFATFELNSFKSRNITSTVGSQVEVTTASIILDAYKAFEKLSEHPNIDKNKVSITGWSLGGAVALFSGWKPIIKAISKDLKFASNLSFYPPCFLILKIQNSQTLLYIF